MESEDLLYTSLNAELTHLTVGSHFGYKVFHLNPLQLISESTIGNYKIVEAYENTQLLILVGAGEEPAYSPRRLCIFNTLQKEVICETTFSESVLSVRMNKLRITVVTIDKLYIYNTTTMKTISVLQTCENPKGIQALSPSQSASYLLFPASESVGLLQVYDCFTLQHRATIEAHNSSLSCICISFEGHLCATASVKGTMIRVFTLPEGKKLFSYKRGLVNAEIYSLSFSQDSLFLVTTSSTGTVHIYDIRLNRIQQQVSWSNMVKTSLISAASYILPEAYRDSLETSRSLVTAKPRFNKKFTAALLPRSNTLAVFSYSGDVIYFSVDLENGGEAAIIQTTNLAVLTLNYS